MCLCAASSTTPSQASLCAASSATPSHTRLCASRLRLHLPHVSAQPHSISRMSLRSLVFDSISRKFREPGGHPRGKQSRRRLLNVWCRKSQSAGGVNRSLPVAYIAVYHPPSTMAPLLVSFLAQDLCPPMDARLLSRSRSASAHGCTSPISLKAAAAVLVFSNPTSFAQKRRQSLKLGPSSSVPVASPQPVTRGLIL